MATLQELLTQKEALEREIEQTKKRDRAEAIAKVRALMAEYGLTLSDLSNKATPAARAGRARQGACQVPRRRHRRQLERSRAAAQVAEGSAGRGPQDRRLQGLIGNARPASAPACPASAYRRSRRSRRAGTGCGWSGAWCCAAAYYASGMFGLATPQIGAHVSLIWPAAGLAFAALVRLGPRHVAGRRAGCAAGGAVDGLAAVGRRPDRAGQRRRSCAGCRSAAPAWPAHQPRPPRRPLALRPGRRCGDAAQRDQRHLLAGAQRRPALDAGARRPGLPGGWAT